MREVTAASLVIASPRKRGRPAKSDALAPVTAWVPSQYLDRLDQLARKHDVSVSKLVCKAIEESLTRR
jgi:hypothetical protein